MNVAARVLALLVLVAAVVAGVLYLDSIAPPSPCGGAICPPPD